ncbi:uncharacterized protein LOC126901393 [Daktulosphaira vitifoliae]|uniref:uncharacterized protein LOC126901393 n=1 Tax=Daktulosphaira vitifoliae TaxID=58002 RepID=UPI0021AA0102|nr:uncharacterized protein LOC126901393 [Daktulosphaira vitifoliae]
MSPPVARAMCDRLASRSDGLVPFLAVARSMPSSPNAVRSIVAANQQPQQQQLQLLEKTSSVPDLVEQRRQLENGCDASEQKPASTWADSKSDSCLIESVRTPVNSLSGTFLSIVKTGNENLDGQKDRQQNIKTNGTTMATADCTRDMHQDGLILPRKPVNPCLTSADHQNLHRELLFNQKIGKSVLGQKSELQKALEKHKRAQTQKELEQQKNSCRTPFERMIEERAKKIETQMEKIDVKDKDEDKPEFLQVHAKLRARMTKTD